MKEFTIREMSEYDGKKGKPACFAYRGKVYDVSNSLLWKGGRHQVLHDAGKDLTQDLDRAPHGEDMFERVPQIGILKRD